MKLTTLPLLLFVAYAQQPTQDPLLRWMDQIAQKQLQRREDAIAKIHNVADAERRKQSVRETFLSLIGGLPDYGGPLNPSITGRIQAENYTIEKVVFESLPGFFVTANLYRPNQAGRYPGVLLQAGHTQEGKPEGQRLAANLKRLRTLVRCNMPAAMRDERFGSDHGIRARHDDGVHGFAPFRTRNADDCALRNGGVKIQNILNLCRVHVVTA